MMKRNHSFNDSHGNAAIYVLIVVALFAALSFIVARQNTSSESTRLDDDRLQIVMTQVLAYPYQVKQAIQMMTDTGSEASDLDYDQPEDVNYDTPPFIHKVFHPQGGGLLLARLPEAIRATATTNPDAGWYLGRFNNVEWTETTEQDTILTAWGISAELCAALNQKLLGSATIPVATDSLQTFLIDTKYHSLATQDFEIATCPDTDSNGKNDCDGVPSMCIQASGSYGFYTVILAR